MSLPDPFETFVGGEIGVRITEVQRDPAKQVLMIRRMIREETLVLLGCRTRQILLDLENRMEGVDAGVRAELHVYARGGHGFGMRNRPLPITSWPVRFHEWMADHGFLSRASSSR